MERLLAGTMLFAAIIQAQMLFVGAFQISLQTNWTLLANYLRQEIVVAYQEATKPAPQSTLVAEKRAPKPSKVMFIDSSAEDDAVKPKP
ncbi:MAG: hypothetical protein KBA75_06170 [Alphaproteobacteria bacterium]|nr:hypothetical protein [Alphaproteobacteria bacterium]